MGEVAGEMVIGRSELGWYMRWVMDTRIVLSVGIGLLMAVGVGGADDRSPEVKRMVGVYAKQRSDALRKLNEQMIRKLLEIKSNC